MFQRECDRSIVNAAIAKTASVFVGHVYFLLWMNNVGSFYTGDSRRGAVEWFVGHVG